jgi:hypothetical protein
VFRIRIQEGQNWPTKYLPVVKKFHFSNFLLFFWRTEVFSISWKSCCVLAHCPTQVTNIVPSGVSDPVPDQGGPNWPT